MNNAFLNRLLNDCKSDSIELALDSLDDLGYLIERFTVIRKEEDNSKVIEEYKILFIRKELISVVLSEDDYNYILYYLFYLLMNFHDRSYRTAWCLGKCYDKSIQKGIRLAAEAFISEGNDDTVAYLIKAITDTNEFEDIEEETLELFRKIKESSLLYSSEFANNQLDFYKKKVGNCKVSRQSIEIR